MAILETNSRLTSKGQTTIPVSVRRALKVDQGDLLRFRIISDGVVEIVRDEGVESDPVVSAYLDLLERDMIANPGKLSVLQRDPSLQKLLAGVEVEEFDLSAG
jgi:antitoxin PrlF